MNRPEWKHAPSYSNWLAMDANGIWCWFVNEPYKGYEHWLPSLPDYAGIDSFDIVDGEFIPHEDWTKSLEPRP